MARLISHDVFKLILSFKDPRYESVRKGIKTDSAKCMPLYYELDTDDTHKDALFIVNLGAKEYLGSSKRPNNPYIIAGGTSLGIKIYSLCEMDDFVFEWKKCNYWRDFSLDGSVNVVFNTKKCSPPNELARPASDLWWQCDRVDDL